MGADYIVHLSCNPKLAFGDGDPLKGAATMMDMIKGRNMALFVAQKSEGRDPATIKIKRMKVTPEGQFEETTSYTDLMARTAPLEAQQKFCEGCPANFLGRPYGCYGALNYPVTAAGEQWLVSRLQPADSPGGMMLVKAIHDFNYDGAPVRRMREGGIFDLKQPAEKVVEKKLLGSKRVNGDQIFQAFISVGGALGADHCGMLLIILGALEIDGRVPATSDDVDLLRRAMLAEAPARRDIAKLQLGPQSPETDGIQNLLRGAYTAWVLGVDLLMDA